MGRRLDIDQLVGTAEIVDRLGVGRPQVVHDWRRRHPDFPRPIARISSVLVWYWPEIRAWARRTGRLP